MHLNLKLKFHKDVSAAEKYVSDKQYIQHNLAVPDGKEVFKGFDVFRFENGQVVEHREVMESIPPKEDWKNENGKF